MGYSLPLNAHYLGKAKIGCDEKQLENRLCWCWKDSGAGGGEEERGVTDLENSGLRKIKGNNLWDTQWLDENQEDLG